MSAFFGDVLRCYLYYFGTSKSSSEVEFKFVGNLFLENFEPFLTMFYTINSSPFASLNEVRHNLTQNEAKGAATASVGHAPIAPFCVRIMTSCISIKRGVMFCFANNYFE